MLGLLYKAPNIQRIILYEEGCGSSGSFLFCKFFSEFSEFFIYQTIVNVIKFLRLLYLGKFDFKNILGGFCVKHFANNIMMCLRLFISRSALSSMSGQTRELDGSGLGLDPDCELFLKGDPSFHSYSAVTKGWIPFSFAALAAASQMAFNFTNKRPIQSGELLCSVVFNMF